MMRLGQIHTDPRFGRPPVYAIHTLLTLENRDGLGWRVCQLWGPDWLEWLNPAEVFGEFVPVHRYSSVTYRVGRNGDHD